MIDSGKRSLAKAVSWRLIAVVLLGIISFWITGGNIVETSLITLCYHGLQVFMFFLHERLWNYIKWGKTKGLLVQMTGLSGSGKSTLARLAQQRLIRKGYKVEVIDGDEYRDNLCKDLGFSEEDRHTNIHRLGFVGKVLARNGVIAIIAAINPYQKIRNEVKSIGVNVQTVYVSCPMEIIKDRDPKGLYRRALLHADHPDHIDNFTGISDPYEAPQNADLTLETGQQSIESAAVKLEKFILQNVV